MAAGASASFFLIVCFLVCSSNSLTNITADVGENATLSCPVPDNYKPFTAVEWRRPDQDSKPVLVFRNGRLDTDNQHESYQNRVDLQDKEMKDGNFSVVLKNVMMEDNGTYHCRVFQGTKNEVISSFNLKVYPPGNKTEITGDGGDKDVGDMVAVIVGPVGAVIVLLAVAYFGSLIYKRSRKNPNLSVPTEEAAYQNQHVLSQQQNQPHLLHL